MATAVVGGVGGQVVAVLATGLLVLAAIPLSRLWTPGEGGFLYSRSGQAYLDREAVDVYRATLEDALAVGDGDLAERDERMLARMRERLGISDREHSLLLQALDPRPDADGNLLGEGGPVAGRYEGQEELATGGHGATYRARDTQLGEETLVVMESCRRAR